MRVPEDDIREMCIENYSSQMTIDPNKELKTQLSP